jgi:hypothetical protein
MKFQLPPLLMQASSSAPPQRVIPAKAGTQFVKRRRDSRGAEIILLPLRTLGPPPVKPGDQRGDDALCFVLCFSPLLVPPRVGKFCTTGLRIRGVDLPLAMRHLLRNLGPPPQRFFDNTLRKQGNRCPARCCTMSRPGPPIPHPRASGRCPWAASGDYIPIRF